MTAEHGVKVVGPDGIRYSVRSVRDGDFVVKTFDSRDWRTFPVWVVVRSIEALRHVRRRGWAVVIVREPIRHSRFNYSQARMVHREHVDDASAITATVQDIAERIGRGDLP